MHGTGKTSGTVKCAICGSATDLRFAYDAPPQGELLVHDLMGSQYRREYYECRTCGHFTGWMPTSPEGLYKGAYVEATYGGLDGIRRNFARITALPPEKSDNVQRTAWIRHALASHGGRLPGAGEPPRLLDIGFGLGVFPAAMQACGWRCDGIDLDPRQVEHAREDLGIAAYCADFLTITGIGPFDLITFNKVLEHVVHPAEFLVAARRHLAPGGFVYVEFPDAEGAAAQGPNREEFFIDHLHVFSFASLCLLARSAGWRPVECVRVHEPSGKFSLRALLSPDD